MAFTDFKNLGQVAKTFDLVIKNAHFLEEANIDTLLANEWLHDEVKFVFEQGLYRTSEIAIGEQLIYPILKEVWRNHFVKQFLLWSHTSVFADNVLCGIPDYIVAARTQYDNAVVGPPLLLVIEAKKDNFEEGWGQCAAEMVAAQKLNEEKKTIYGVVSNGDKWEFAYLENNVFTKNILYTDVLEIDRLYAVLHHIFKACL